jgi:hypothetical protein
MTITTFTGLSALITIAFVIYCLTQWEWETTDWESQSDAQHMRSDSVAVRSQQETTMTAQHEPAKLFEQLQLQMTLVKTLSDRIRQLESYRYHHAQRLGQLEDRLERLVDLVALLNRDAPPGVQYDLDHTQVLEPVIRATAASKDHASVSQSQPAESQHTRSASVAVRRRQIENPEVEMKDLTPEDVAALSDPRTRTQALYDLDDTAFMPSLKP